jgi:hypothetical protein
MFEAELMLRRALKARFAPAPLVGTSRDSGADSGLLQHKAAG